MHLSGCPIYRGHFFMPLMYSVVLTALVNIQDQLENPFDQYGEDDVVFHTGRFIASLEQDSPKTAPQSVR